MRLPACLAACLLAMLLLCAPAMAGAAEPAAVPPDPAAAGDLLNGYNRIIFAFNRTIYSWLDSLLPAAPEPSPSAAPAPGPARVISNLINEPLTLLSSLLVGDLSTAWNAAERFGINSTAGVLGWWDEASLRGYEPVPADIGLSLCRMGVGEGGYVMLPFIGPRTYRDAAADVILVNALLWTTTGAIVGSGLSVQTIIIAESIEVAADIVATRQIDPRAKEIHFDNFDQMRANYLVQRRHRCGRDTAMTVAAAPAIP